MSSGSDEDDQKPPAVSNKELNKLKNSKKNTGRVYKIKKKKKKKIKETEKINEPWEIMGRIL